MRKMSVLLMMIVAMLLALAVPAQAINELWVSGSERSLARFDGTTGAFIDWAARPPGYDASSPLRGPQGLTYAGGFVYVASWNSDEIFKFDPAGAYGSWSVFASGAGIADPRDMTLGPDGNFYVTSDTQQAVVKVAPDGTIIGNFTSADGGILTMPSGLAFGADGDLYVSQYDTTGTRNAGFVAKYDGSTGAYLGNVLEARDATPIDYAHIKDVISYGDNIYAPVDNPHGEIYQIATDVPNVGNWIGTVFAGEAWEDRLGQGLQQITLGPDGNIYIADASAIDPDTGAGWDCITSYDGTTGAIIHGGGADKGQPEPFIDNISSLGGGAVIGLVFVNDEGPATPKNRGDVTEDLFVGADDLVRILTHWGESGAEVTWGDGDCAPYGDGIDTGDQFVGADDYVEVLSMWGTSYPAEPTPTPEPTTLGLLLLGGLLAVRRPNKV